MVKKRETVKTIIIATRGSALALAQANQVLKQCRLAFPKLAFDLRIIKTTGDKLQTAAMANPEGADAKGLFTKELELALLNREADLAVHSLKDLPTDLPEGLVLGAVCKRADVRDVLIYRDAAPLQPAAAVTQTAPVEWSPGEPRKRGFAPGLAITGLPQGAVVATSSTRRQAQLLALRPDLKVVPIRGNVGTRLQKLNDQAALDALILAAAGLERLQFKITPKGKLHPPANKPTPNQPPLPTGLLATCLEPEIMLPCVGQAAIGIEVRANDETIAPICQALNHHPTCQCVTAERSFLHTMGGGCQSPVAAYAEWRGHEIRLRAVSFRSTPTRRAEIHKPAQEAVALGAEVARQLL